MPPVIIVVVKPVTQIAGARGGNGGSGGAAMASTGSPSAGSITGGGTVSQLGANGGTAQSGGNTTASSGGNTTASSGTAADGNAVALSSTGAVAGSVVLYTDRDFAGGYQTLQVGTYDRVAADNSISSLRVPRGFKVTLYEDANFDGKAWTFTADAAYVGDAINDKASSVVVTQL